MSDARIGAIRAAMLTRIQAISVSGGFHVDIGETGLLLKWPERIVGDSPAAFVWSSRSDREIVQLNDGDLSRESVSIVTVTGWTQGPSAQTETDNFLRDIVNAVESDPKNLSLSYVVSIVNSAHADMVTEDELGKPFGRVDAEFTVRYRMPRGEV